LAPSKNLLATDDQVQQDQQQQQSREEQVSNDDDAAIKSANLLPPNKGRGGPMSLQEFEAQAALYSPTFEEKVKSKIKDGKVTAAERLDLERIIPHKLGGRWCRCVDAAING